MELASKLEPVVVSAGAVIIEQGERGDTCYLLRCGHVEVVMKKEDGSERRLATLGPGTLFGEAALLTDAPRNATVRAFEACGLLALRRDDLMDAMKADQRTIAQMMELMSLRDRPRQTKGIIAHQHSTPEGETITILKNPRQGSYYRLSPQGWFLWQLLDGQHTVRDLTLDYMGQFKAFAPQAIAEVLCGLGAAGFLERKSLSGDVTEAVSHLTRWQRALVMARRILEWQVSVRNIDGALTWLYRAGIRWIYTRAGQVILGLLSLAGLIAFILIGGRAGLALHHTGSSALLLFLIPAYLFSILLHEAGHAFTVKAFGYEVPRAGVGWYWFGPVAFVDTSDIWLAGRWPRIAVSLAGPYANLALGSLAALAAWLSSSPAITAALWAFTLVSYVMVLINFNPLLEYDGYYVLMDWLERPNLRPRALAWLGSELPQALRAPEELREHCLKLIYGLGSLLYIVLMCVLTLVSYRLFVQNWMAQLLPVAMAEALAWVMAAAVLVLSAASVVGELRGARSS